MDNLAEKDNSLDDGNTNKMGSKGVPKNPTAKKPMTHEERLQLAAKLDKELDDFIKKLPRKKYEDGWPEDRWEEEMNRHPFFMKEPPKPGQEVHPLMEGLQALKYDPEENEPEELANSYKDDGNFNFKYKNYRLAVLSYTEGIKVKCGNNELNATLFNNRSAAHYFLKNFRSSLKDAEEALKLKPGYDKALIRAANCCFEMKNYKRCIDFCDKILDNDKSNAVILELKKKCMSEDKLKERNERKKDAEFRKQKKIEDNLINKILQNGYKLEGSDMNQISLEQLDPYFPQLIHNKVHLDDTDHLVWPVILVYPEYKMMDYIQEFKETNLFFDQLSEVFNDPPEWDTEKKYKLDNLNIYVETMKRKLIKIDMSSSLKDASMKDGVIIKSGTPSFIILVRGSPAEIRFLSEY